MHFTLTYRGIVHMQCYEDFYFSIKRDVRSDNRDLWGRKGWKGFSQSKCDGRIIKKNYFFS